MSLKASESLPSRLVALEIAQTVVEEEVVRRVHVSAPTRVRRYLSRFVVVVALSIKHLVTVVRFLDEDPRLLWSAASIGMTTAAILASWGIFVRLNRWRRNWSLKRCPKRSGKTRRYSRFQARSPFAYA